MVVLDVIFVDGGDVAKLVGVLDVIFVDGGDVVKLVVVLDVISVVVSRVSWMAVVSAN